MSTYKIWYFCIKTSCVHSINTHKICYFGIKIYLVYSMSTHKICYFCIKTYFVCTQSVPTRFIIFVLKHILCALNQYPQDLLFLHENISCVHSMGNHKICYFCIKTYFVCTQSVPTRFIIFASKHILCALNQYPQDLLFLHQNIFCGYSLELPAIPMSIHKICFDAKITKIILNYHLNYHLIWSNNPLVFFLKDGWRWMVFRRMMVPYNSSQDSYYLNLCSLQPYWVSSFLRL